TRCSTLVDLFRATTVDPAAAAPAGSVTRPVRLAVFICENELTANRATHARIRKVARVCRRLVFIFDLIICFSNQGKLRAVHVVRPIPASKECAARDAKFKNRRSILTEPCYADGT